MTIEDSNQLCRKFKAIRKQANYRQEEIAKALNMDRSAFAKMEANKNKISLDKFIAWANLLNFKLILEEIYE
jgi:transcriptional regulator with XRE-family HTH domain